MRPAAGEGDVPAARLTPGERLGLLAAPVAAAVEGVGVGQRRAVVDVQDGMARVAVVGIGVGRPVKARRLVNPVVLLSVGEGGVPL